jgi:hypothetical protein
MKSEAENKIVSALADGNLTLDLMRLYAMRRTSGQEMPNLSA